MGVMATEAEGSRARPYRGVEAADRLAERRRRLLAAGLELLGADQQDVSGLTVRGICREAGVATRYFYESFTEKDEFVAGVFDWVVAELATRTQAAVTTVPAHDRTRAGMATLVSSIADDPRVGRLLFSNQLTDAVVIRKRAESTALFVMLSGQYALGALRMTANDRIKAAAHFVVGGVGQILSAWLGSDIRLEPEELVDQLVVLVDRLSDPRLYGLMGRAEVATIASPDPGATAAS